LQQLGQLPVVVVVVGIKISLDFRVVPVVVVVVMLPLGGLAQLGRVLLAGHLVQAPQTATVVAVVEPGLLACRLAQCQVFRRLVVVELGASSTYLAR
jgi:hypothetical protein